MKPKSIFLILMSLVTGLLGNIEKGLNDFLDHALGAGLVPQLAGAGLMEMPDMAPQEEAIVKFCVDGKDLEPDDCDVVASPGTSQTIYYAFVRDIDEEPEVTDTPVATNPQDAILLLGDYVMKTDKYFHSIKCQVNMNSMQNEFMGERGSGNWQNRGEFFIKSNRSEVAGIMSAVARQEAVFVIPLKDGATAVIGTKEHPAYVKPMFDTLTDEATDPRGWRFSIVSIDKQPWRLHADSVIPLDPGI
jgi:hypothetical protein